GPCLSTNGPSNKLVFPVMALLAGILGGVFGIGGGMLISPLLLHVGIAPEVTAATCSFMVFFSSTMSALQYLLLGMEHIQTALILAIICFVASLLGFGAIEIWKDYTSGRYMGFKLPC
ncbi:Transmembrane protein, partial [Sesbania bispinosa]